RGDGLSSDRRLERLRDHGAWPGHFGPAQRHARRPAGARRRPAEARAYRAAEPSRRLAGAVPRYPHPAPVRRRRETPMKLREGLRPDLLVDGFDIGPEAPDGFQPVTLATRRGIVE